MILHARAGPGRWGLGGVRVGAGARGIGSDDHEVNESREKVVVQLLNRMALQVVHWNRSYN